MGVAYWDGNVPETSMPLMFHNHEHLKFNSPHVLVGAKLDV